MAKGLPSPFLQACTRFTSQEVERLPIKSNSRAFHIGVFVKRALSSHVCSPEKGIPSAGHGRAQSRRWTSSVWCGMVWYDWLRFLPGPPMS